MYKCPYNSEHIIQSHKIHTHVKKCKDAKKDGRKLLKCQKDLSIMFLETDVDYHNSQCKYCESKNSNLNSNVEDSLLENLVEISGDNKSFHWNLDITEPVIDLNETTDIETRNISSNNNILSTSLNNNINENSVLEILHNFGKTHGNTQEKVTEDSSCIY